MNNRINEMKQIILPYKVAWTEEKIEYIKKSMNTDKILKTNESFLNIICMLLQKVILNQSVNNQNEISYFCFFYLHSSILTGSYEYQLSLSNECLYLDEKLETDYWIPSFIVEDFDSNADTIKKILMKKFTKISPYEISFIRKEIEGCWHMVISVYISLMIKDIIKLEEFKNLKKSNAMKFLYGEFMGKLLIIPSEWRDKIG